MILLVDEPRSPAVSDQDRLMLEDLVSEEPVELARRQVPSRYAAWMSAIVVTRK